jgi:YbbR domain-containing protein
MRDIFFKDIGWKLFSLLLAAAIWFTVHRILHEAVTALPDETVRTVTYDNLPVTPVSMTADVHAYSVAPASVKIAVTGPDSAMNTLQANEIHATANITGASLTHGQLVPVEISLPAKVAVVSIEPDKVLVVVPPAPQKNP